MSSPKRRSRSRPSAGLAIAVLVGVSTALLPLLRVVEPGAWLVGAFAIIALVLAAGYVARRFGLPPLTVSLIGIGVWVVTVSVVFFRSSALFGVIPMPATFRDIPLLVDAAMTQVRDGAAPLDAGVALSFLIVAAAGLLAIAIDHVVVSARMPLLAAVALITIYLIPAIAVPRSVDIGTFIAFAAGLMLLLGGETATRDRGGNGNGDGDRARAEGTRRGTAVTAVGVGAAALVVAIVATPALPAPVPGGTSIVAIRGNTIDPSLDLGRDLRRPADTAVLQVRSDAPTPPYLRAVTLSRFDGDEWKPDRGIGTSVDEEFEPLVVDSDIPIAEYTATVQVVNYVSPWLPVPYPAVSVDGLEGDWSVLPQNRTVISRSSSPQGQEYEITYDVPRPSAERIRSSEAALGSDSSMLDLPENDPAVAAIREQALAVTSATSSDYDALVALQRWFRGLEFEYSLNAPVRAGFDGTGLEAVQEFLAVKSGYCVHFASAFAIMARTLGMPARIVVGYLPGTATTDSIDDETVYEVYSSQLHSWPEVYFEGIGWIPFEPTKSLGVPTAFASSTIPGTADGLTEETAPLAPEAPSASLPPDQTDGLDETGAAAGDTTVGAGPSIVLVLAVFAASALPGLWRAIRRRHRLIVAHTGDAPAAWAEASDTAADLGIALPRGESPRVLGRRLVDEHGADAASMAVLVAAIEHSSYAPTGSASERRSGEPLDDAVRAVRGGMIAASDRRTRWSAALVPKSLFGRRGAEARVTG
ncbi:MULTISPECIES: transglutaminase family protein [Bacteria]